MAIALDFDSPKRFLSERSFMPLTLGTLSFTSIFDDLSKSQQQQVAL